jgi:CheY-like chemotaxis protein
MATRNVLFVENDPTFLESRKEFLVQEGYRVFTATNRQEAKQILAQERVDLALLDIRLEDDKACDDNSGVMLAQEIAPFAPCIILTGFSSVDHVRDALRSRFPGPAVAVDFITKQEGPEALLCAVRSVLGRPKVFLVHGHDEAAKEIVARCIERLGVQVIILHEQPSAGRTIIEKLEDYADASDFAVVLLSPDDFGGSQRQPRHKRPRARQNVVFELGYFIGKLGRHKVWTLSREEVEIPSDYHGVLYLPMDPGGGWRRKLEQEMRHAGVDINPS